ncbi:unnamed protein product [Rotaria sp. Silwood2]|nr:unnamed protein product [Rotaria sp. Silwood2]CAF2479368.1 unnamed protein product [Rotaria sp. Silwood2]CAF3922487.1 unnamed protein product [Rotaria sp. Silwood2]
METDYHHYPGGEHKGAETKRSFSKNLKHRQQVSQEMANYDPHSNDFGDMQRENIVKSLANDETLLNDFLRFRQQQQPVLPKLGQYGSSRYENVLVSIQPTQNYSNHAKSIPTRFVVQPEASTPNKRRLNDSSGSGGLPTSKQQRSNNKQIQANQVILSAPYEQRSGDTTSKSAHQRKIPFEQVKRAISSNLPCFYITFNHVDTSQQVPSAFNAAEQIVQHLKQQDIRINRFTFVGWAGAKLKLGVNNKADYINLVSTVKWSTNIMNISITIEKPKFIPDCFALVIRYVPRGMDYEFIREEVSRSIASVENVKQLQYAYNRKTDDYRFRVKDFHEYDRALSIWRISIGNAMLPITPFLQDNKITYCTRCWCIGHMKNRCQASSAHCHICSSGNHRYSST